MEGKNGIQSGNIILCRGKSPVRRQAGSPKAWNRYSQCYDEAFLRLPFAVCAGLIGDLFSAEYSRNSR
jgi:hypothetical protein